jgi:hypothetical protein
MHRGMESQVRASILLSDPRPHFDANDEAAL